MNLNQESHQFSTELRTEYGNLKQALKEIKQLPPEVRDDPEDPVIRNTFIAGKARKQELKTILEVTKRKQAYIS